MYRLYDCYIVIQNTSKSIALILWIISCHFMIKSNLFERHKQQFSFKNVISKNSSSFGIDFMYLKK